MPFVDTVRGFGPDVRHVRMCTPFLRLTFRTTKKEFVETIAWGRYLSNVTMLSGTGTHIKLCQHRKMKKNVLLPGMPWAAICICKYEGTSLSVYLLECTLLAEVYQSHTNHRSKHNPSFMDQNTPFRMQLKPSGSYKHS